MYSKFAYVRNIYYYMRIMCAFKRFQKINIKTAILLMMIIKAV